MEDSLLVTLQVISSFYSGGILAQADSIIVFKMVLILILRFEGNIRANIYPDLLAVSTFLARGY